MPQSESEQPGDLEKLRVLLLSPIQGLDPACGDTTYTSELLSAPPLGVEYEDYRSALASGRLIEHGVRTGPRRPSDIAIAGVRHAMQFGRQHGFMLWEPFRFFSVQEGAYDLIHCHVFHHRILGAHPPVVVSNSSPVDDLYLVARNWSQTRFLLARRIDLSLATALRISHSSYRPRASRIMAFSIWLKNFYISLGFDAASINVVPPFVQPLGARFQPHDPPVVLFVAKDFAAKGGDLVLRAFQELRRKRVSVELWVVGSKAQGKIEGVRWLEEIPRDQLIGDIYPRASVLAYPTRVDGPPSLVVLEALSAGVPVVTSNYRAMPEAVGYGRAGIVADGPSDFVQALEASLSPEINERLRAGARAHFAATYAPDVVRRLIRETYDQSLADEG